jgi:hypothetical protein
MTTSDIESISFNLGIIMGIIFLIIYTILSYFLRKKAMKKIERNLLESEYIVLEPKVVFVIDVICPLSVGGFLGMYVFPFLFYPEIQSINSPYTGSINREYLPLCITIILIALFFTLLISATKCVFTNKRIINASSFKVFNKFIKFAHINYSDIKGFKYENILNIETLTIYLQNEKNYVISGFKNLKDFQSIIQKYCLIKT